VLFYKIVDTFLANASIPSRNTLLYCLPFTPKLATALATNMPGLSSTTKLIAINNLDFFAAAKWAR